MSSSRHGLHESSFMALFMMLALALFLAASESASAADFTVTKTADTNDGTCDADCSLREAIEEAIVSGAVDTIMFSAAAFPPGALATIAVTLGELPTMDAEIVDGSGAGVIIDGSAAGVGGTGLSFNSGGALTGATVRNVTIRNFSDIGIDMNAGTDLVDATIDGVVLEGNGAGINLNAVANNTRSSISNSAITGSNGTGININAGADTTVPTILATTVTGSGGTGIDINARGIFNRVTIRDATVSNNDDGGIVVCCTGQSSTGVSLTIIDTSIADNTSSGDGGGISVIGGTLITGSTISRNFSDNAGGGIANFGFLTVTNSTISENEAFGAGGGIYSETAQGVTTLFLTNVTIAGNAVQSFGTGGGLYTQDWAQVLNTIIANNIDQGIGGPDCVGPTLSQGHNLIEDTTSCAISDYDTTSNITGVDPELGALADNGGPTFTHAFAAGSPPHNAGSTTNSGFGLYCPATDQRGVARPQEGACDIGAYELQGVTPSGAPTQAPAALPPTGGPVGDGANQAWLIALAALGAAGVAGMGTFVVTRRRE